MDLKDYKPTSSLEEINFLFANKFKSIPVVNSTCFWLAENYNKLKEKNFVTKCTCDLAEITIKSSLYLATPFVSKFKDQVIVLDLIACNQLDKLENAFPIIKSNPDKIVSQSKELINKTVRPAFIGYSNFKENTENNYKIFKEFYKNKESLRLCKTDILAGKLINSSQSFIENYFIYDQISATPNMNKVEDYIQIYLDYKEQLTKKKLSYEVLFQHIRILTYVLFYSLEAKLTRYSNESIKQIKSYFSKILKLFEYYDSIKQSFKAKFQEKFHVTKEKIDLYKEYIDLLSKQFTVQDGRQLSQINSLEERTKIIIRRCLGNLIILFYLIYTRVNSFFPVIESTFVMQNFQYMYQAYPKNDKKICNFLNRIIINEIQSVPNKFQLYLNSCIKYLNNSPTALWFVPHFDSFGILVYEDEEESNHTVFLNNNYTTSSTLLTAINTTDFFFQ